MLSFHCLSSQRLFLAIILSLCFLANGHLNYLDQFPNGAKVRSPYGNTSSWIGVGHQDSMGMSGINQFGKDFHRVGGNWKRLCVLDSDGDGQSNGMELGDPCCVWKQGDTPFRTWDISHPGSKDSITRAMKPACAGQTCLTNTMASLYRLGVEESVLVFYIFCTSLFFCNTIFIRFSVDKNFGLLPSLWKKVSHLVAHIGQRYKLVPLDPVVILYLIFQVFFCRYLYFYKYISQRSPLTRCTGELAICNLGLLLFPVSRNSPLWSMMRTSFEQVLSYHRFLGYYTVFLSSWHAVGMFQLYMYQHRGFSFLFSFSSNNVRFNLPGVVGYLFILVLGILALNCFRRRAFEIFYYSHFILFPLSLVFTVIHVDFAGYYFIPGLASLGVDYILRIHRTYELTTLNVRVFQDAIRITFVRPGAWKYTNIGGHYGFFKVPHLAWIESHPFSVFSLEPNTLNIVVKKGMKGSFTDKLHKAFYAFCSVYDDEELIQSLQHKNAIVVQGDENALPTAHGIRWEAEKSPTYMSRWIPRIFCVERVQKFFPYLEWILFGRRPPKNDVEKISLLKESSFCIWRNLSNGLLHECTPLVTGNMKVESYESSNWKKPSSKVSFEEVAREISSTSHPVILDDADYQSLEEAFPERSLKEMSIQVQGPYGHVSCNPLYFPAILLCAGGVGITGMLSILCDIYQHPERNKFADITLCWTITDISHLDWVQDVIFTIRNDQLLSEILLVEIYVTRGDLHLALESSGYEGIHFYLGRPDWNEVIHRWKHKSLSLGVNKGVSYVCGPASMVSQVQEKCNLLETDDWSCIVSTESFEF